MAYAAICIMSIVWVGIQFNCMNLYAAPVVEELGITRTQFMTVLSIPGLISATVSLLAFGAIEENIGLRRMLLIGGILNTLAFVCWFFMDSVALLYLGGTLYGCGCSITAYNSVAAGVNRWFKQRIGSLMGVANALGNVAGIVFALVIAAIIATIGWRYSFGICIVISAIATVVCTVLYKGNPDDLGVRAMYEDEAMNSEAAFDEKAKATLERDAGALEGVVDAAPEMGIETLDGTVTETVSAIAQTERPSVGAAETAAVVARTGKLSNAAAETGDGTTQVEKPSGTLSGVPFREAIATPRMWLLAFGYLLLGTTTYGLMSTLPLFALDFGFEQLQGQVVSASLLAAAIAMVPLGIICDRFGTKWTVALCGVLMALAAVLLLVPSLPFVGVLVAAACSGASYSSCGVAVGTGVKEAFDEFEFSKKLGLCSGCMYIGLAVGPALINLVYDTMGTYSYALIAFAICAAVIALIFFRNV